MQYVSAPFALSPGNSSAIALPRVFADCLGKGNQRREETESSIICSAVKPSEGARRVWPISLTVGRIEGYSTASRSRWFLKLFVSPLPSNGCQR